MNEQNNPARPIARFIILILVVGSGFSLFATLAGNTRFGLITCGGALGLSVLVLLLGAVVVGANRSAQAED